MKSLRNRWGFGGNAPNKHRPVLQVREVSEQVTRAVGTAKSLPLTCLKTFSNGAK